MSGMLTLLGAGWREDDLTLGAVKALKNARQLVLQTEKMGCAEWLTREGIALETLDPIYEQAEDFDEFVLLATDFIATRLEKGDVVYACAELSDRVACALASRFPARLIAGVQTGGELCAYSGASLRVVAAIEYEDFTPQADVATLVRELDNPMYVAEMKLRLMNCYPEEHEILLLRADGSIRRVPLCDIDRQGAYDHQTCALIPALGEVTALERFDFDCLTRIVRRLRAFDGCPWDREQTHESLKGCLIEEAYEAVDAINRQDEGDLCDELGDVLLQVAFHAEIAREHGEFDASDVATAICRKMIRRHPHVFAGKQADDLAAEWDRIKREEKGNLSPADSLREVARALPALTRARKVLTRAARAGLCDSDPEKAFSRLDEALISLKAALASGASLDECGGEALLCLVNLLRMGQTDPEMLLSETIDRAVEQLAPKASVRPE